MRRLALYTVLLKRHTMRNLFTVLFILLVANVALAQGTKQWGVKFSGYVKADYIYDSRQTVSSREQQFLLYPAAQKLSKDGVDMNAVPTFNMLAVQSRLKSKISGPDALGAKTSGLIEADFLGHNTGDINGFRLRHAYVKLDWGRTELLFGQYWNPMFVPEVYPTLINMNPGTPFKAFSRNPQIRVSHKMGKVKLIVAAVTQRDHRSVGPNGSSSEYSINSGLPAFHGQVQFGDAKSVFGGVNASFKTLVPRTVTGAEYLASDEKVHSFAAEAFFSVSTDLFRLRMEAYYGQNSTNNTMLGGYAVSSISNDEKDKWEYTNLSNASVWVDVQTKGKKVQFGAFAGYTKNLGASENVVDADHVYARGGNIDYVAQVSGRVLFNAGKVRFAVEPSCTVAAYGTVNPDNKAKVENLKPVSNLRVLGAVYYFF